MAIISCMVPEIRSTPDTSFCHFGPIFAFNPLTTQKIKILKKWKKKKKKMPGDIILPMCTTKDNHMMHGSWDMERDGQNFFSFWAISFDNLASKNKIEGDHTFSKYAKSFPKLTFLTLWYAHVRVRIRG